VSDSESDEGYGDEDEPAKEAPKDEEKIEKKGKFNVLIIILCDCTFWSVICHILSLLFV